jgi:hypothetical protein
MSASQRGVREKRPKNGRRDFADAREQLWCLEVVGLDQKAVKDHNKLPEVDVVDDQLGWTRRFLQA